jgi:Tol biopolymer transport system component
LAVVVSACGFRANGAGADAPLVADADAATGSDAGGGSATWGSASPLFDDTGDHDPTLTGDMLELYFDDGSDLWAIVRTGSDQPWGSASRVTSLDTTSIEQTPELSRDGLTIYFASNRMVGDDTHIWMATRPSRGSDWSTPVAVIALDSMHRDASPTSSADGATIVMNWGEIAGQDDDIYESSGAGVAWTPPQPLASVNGSNDDDNPMLSDDELAIYFDSDRAGDGHHHLYAATRASAGSTAFDAPALLGGANPLPDERAPWISPDGRHLVFESNGTLYEVSR